MRSATRDGLDAVEPVDRLGHYHATYEKTDGRWRIKTSKLVRKHKAYR